MRGLELVGYEIHMGHTRSVEADSAFEVFETPQGTANYADGALNAQGTVLGSYLHGLFHNPGFRQALLNRLRRHYGLAERWGGDIIDKEQHYDRLADVVRRSLNMAAIYQTLDEGIDE